MGNIKKELEKVYDYCTELYSEGGASAVIDHVNEQMELNNPLYADVEFMQCTPCDAEMPTLNNVCLVCGSIIDGATIDGHLGPKNKPYPEIGRKILTIGEVKELLSDLNDDDIAILEACDANGDTQDLYPMYIDVIEGIELLNGKTVNEVRFCQMPNTPMHLPTGNLDDLKKEIREGDVVKIKPLIDTEKINKWADEMSDTLYTMRAESDLGSAMLCTPNTNNPVPQEFIESTVDNPKHIEKMKEIIFKDIVNHLTQCPDDYKNEKGEYEYQSDVYDFSYKVDSYIERLYEDLHETKEVWVCPDCNSDNVQFKTWTDANSMKATNDECPMEDSDCYCKDCESTSLLVRTKLIPRAKVIGFQVNAYDGLGHEYMHPSMDGSFCIYNLTQAGEMMINSAGDIDSRLVAIWTDDIEEPTFMFEGDPRG